MGRIALIILVGIGYFYFALPRFAQLSLGGGLGFLLRVIGFRKKIVYQNLELAFPGDDARQNAVACESYGSFGNLVFEILMLLGPMKYFVLRNVDLVGTENWKKANDQGKGVIYLSSHIGNWEVMAATGGLIGRMPLMLVTKKLKPDWLHAAIEKGRAGCEVLATYEPRTYRDVLTHLKKKGTVGLVLDQYAGPPVGVRVPVFGVPVGTPTIVATLAKRTGAPVVPVENYRKPDGRWAVVIHPALEWKQDENLHRELALNTAEYTKVLEQHIRAHPGQWLWVHRRFKGDLSPLREDEWDHARRRK